VLDRVRVRDAGAELYAWTVDESALINRLTGLEVTGITTNDPRLFVTA
jgi:glycerophosphoryl diester phosphodiesterase